MIRYARQATSGLFLALVAAALLYTGAGVRALQNTPPPVLAEALEYTNVRSGPGIDYSVIGSIRSGAQYPIIGRYAGSPWLLITFGDPVQPGWIYADLLNITGDINQAPFVEVDAPPDSATPTAPAAIEPVATLTPSPTGTVATPTPTTALTGVTASAIDHANVRCGPGIEYSQVGAIYAGETYPVLLRHASVPWVQISFDGYQTGVAWVYIDVVEFAGDLNAVPTMENPRVDCPLTPTPPAVVPAQSPWDGTQGSQDGGTGVDMVLLGEQIMEYFYEQNYLPRTERQASMFGYNLQTGQGFSLNPGVAYSGMSLIKIPLLITYFRFLEAPPNGDQAYWITGMMTCSNNPSSNAILREMGGGDPYVGAEWITNTMRELGLEHTFLQAPLVEDPSISGHDDLQPIVTSADQISTNPDPYNQTTMDEIGWLLVALYQCGQQERGPLLERISGITPLECRRILYALDQNYLGAMIEAGVPNNVTVAHKHGWSNAEDHADAGIVFTPGGNYVLAIALHQDGWLTYLDAWPNIAEISRRVYNVFNPTAPLADIHPEEVPETCEVEGHPLLRALTQPELPPLQ